VPPQRAVWLAAGAPVTAVAIDLGCDSVSAFITMFRTSLGTTPGRHFTGASAADAANRPGR